jgi:hypothetical protein
MTTTPRTHWVDDQGISDLSVAVDEIYALRVMLADEAAILEAHLEYKTFPKSRRVFAEQQIERMRTAARGDYKEAARPNKIPNSQWTLKNIGAKPTLTNHEWAEQRGLTQVDPT